MLRAKEISRRCQQAMTALLKRHDNKIIVENGCLNYIMDSFRVDDSMGYDIIVCMYEGKMVMEIPLVEYSGRSVKGYNADKKLGIVSFFDLDTFCN